jgi:hypothetical protein
MIVLAIGYSFLFDPILESGECRFSECMRLRRTHSENELHKNFSDVIHIPPWTLVVIVRARKMTIGRTVNTRPIAVTSAPAILFLVLINNTTPVANETRPNSKAITSSNVMNIFNLLSVFFIITY